MAANAAAFARRREGDGNIRFSGEALRLRGEREEGNLEFEKFGEGSVW